MATEYKARSQGGNLPDVAANTNNSLDNSSRERSYAAMSSERHVKKAATEKVRGKERPVWADGLKRMYNSVVDEEIPDEFVELLRQLDEPREPK